MTELTLIFTGILALPWIWLTALILLILVEIILTENEAFVWGGIISITGVALIVWLGSDQNPFSWALANSWFLCKTAIAYVLIGALWSIVKWYFYLIRIKKELVAKGKSLSNRSSITYAKNNKYRITGWMIHWPFSIIATVIGDFLMDLFNGIYNLLSGIYEAIEKHIFEEQ